MKVVAPVDLGTAVSALKGLVGFSSINGMADTAMWTQKQGCQRRHEPMHETCRNWYPKRVTGRGLSSSKDWWTFQSCNRGRHQRRRRPRNPWRCHKSSSWTRLSTCPLWCNARYSWFRQCRKLWSVAWKSRAGWTIFNMTEVESQPMEATTTAKTTSDILVRLFLAVLYTWGRLDDKSLSRPDQEVTLSLVLREAQERHLHRSLTERSLMKSHAIIDAMERANHTLGEALRTLTHATGTRVGSRSETDEPLICWMMRHTTEGPLLRRFGTTVAERTDVCWRSRPGGCAWIETAA